MDMCFHFSGVNTEEEGITGPYNRSRVSLVRNCQNGCTIFTFPKTAYEGLVAPYPHQYLVLSLFLILAICWNAVSQNGSNLHFPNE